MKKYMILLTLLGLTLTTACHAKIFDKTETEIKKDIAQLTSDLAQHDAKEERELSKAISKALEMIEMIYLEKILPVYGRKLPCSRTCIKDFESEFRRLINSAVQLKKLYCRELDERLPALESENMPQEAFTTSIVGDALFSWLEVTAMQKEDYHARLKVVRGNVDEKEMKKLEKQLKEFEGFIQKFDDGTFEHTDANQLFELAFSIDKYDTLADVIDVWNNNTQVKHKAARVRVAREKAVSKLKDFLKNKPDCTNQIADGYSFPFSSGEPLLKTQLQRVYQACTLLDEVGTDKSEERAYTRTFVTKRLAQKNYGQLREHEKPDYTKKVVFRVAPTLVKNVVEQLIQTYHTIADLAGFDEQIMSAEHTKKVAQIRQLTYQRRTFLEQEIPRLVEQARDDQVEEFARVVINEYEDLFFNYGDAKKPRAVARTLLTFLQQDNMQELHDELRRGVKSYSWSDIITQFDVDGKLKTLTRTLEEHTSEQQLCFLKAFEHEPCMPVVGHLTPPAQWALHDTHENQANNDPSTSKNSGWSTRTKWIVGASLVALGAALWARRNPKITEQAQEQIKRFKQKVTQAYQRATLKKNTAAA